MKSTYNLLAGQSVERLGALSDGIFAVAMTLLVLDLKTPGKEMIHSEQELWRILAALAPQAVAYLMSFLTLGIFWTGQQVQLQRFERSDRHLSWLHLLFLFAVTLMPFSNKLLAEFIHYQTILLFYWANIVLLGAVLCASWSYACRAGLLDSSATPDVRKAVERRILVAQALYAFGAVLCVVDTYLSIGFIVLVQLNYVIAPRFRRTK